VLSAMSAMVNLEIPWINVMSKMDLVTASLDDKSGGARNGIRQRKDIARYVTCCFLLAKIGNARKHVDLHLTYSSLRRYLDPDPLLLATRRGQEGNDSNPRFHALNQAIVQLVSIQGSLPHPRTLNTVIL